jgi:phosphoribosylaminoimidazole-succinocarboxamide synthase
VEQIVERIPELADKEKLLRGRTTLCRLAQPIAVECVVRGYLAGSAWTEYREKGTVAEVEMPEGMLRSQKFDTLLFTPATKAESGHDENISIGRMKAMIGRGLAEQMIEASLKLYNFASDYAATRGMLIADTKFEFGLLDGKLILIDEILTPDSSRFWLGENYKPGEDQQGFDKQPLRNWLQKLTDQGKWDKNPPGPELPEDVITYMSNLYESVYKLLTGEDIA